MTISGMARRPRRLRSCLLVLGLVLPCLVWLLPLNFVQGRAWDGNRTARRQLTGRWGQRLPGRPSSADGQAKLLTSRIKKATSAQKLVGILDEAVDGPIFDFIHASAAYTKLVSFKRSRALGQRDWDGAVLPRLHTRVEGMALRGQLRAREMANVVWGLGQLSEQFAIPTQLLAALVKSVPTKVKDMNAFDLSNCLWASAKLKDVAPIVLEIVPAVVAQIPKKAMDAQGLSNCLWASAQLKDVVAPDVLLRVWAIAAQIPKKAKDMKPQELSNSLWASAQLKDVAPDVRKAVPAIVDQIPEKAKDMKPQELSNSIWASAQLKDVAPDVRKAVPAIVDQIPNRAEYMIPQHLSNCLWACLQLANEVPKVLDIVLAIVGQIPAKLQNMNPQDLSNSVEALVLLSDSVPEVAAFLAAGGGMIDILRSSAARLNTLLPSLKGKDLSLAVPNVVWACARARVCDGDLLASVAQRLGSRTNLSTLPDFSVCSLSWSYQVLDTGNDFKDFKQLLMSEATSPERRLSGADVQSCELGRFQWNRS